MFQRKTISALMIFVLILLIHTLEGLYNPLTSHETGAPAAHTGSPGDNFETCTDCHNGPAETIVAGWITSNIPVTGYVPGSTYSVSATINSPGHSKCGFEVSPQDAAGNILGSLMITNLAETKLVGLGNYVTHTAAGTSSPGGTKTWTFDWVAPASGTGDVTFYGAFNATDNGNNQTGDTIYVSTLLVSECQLPLQPSAIVGNTVICPGDSLTYRVNSSPDALSYSWTLPAGWSGTSTDTFITVIAGNNGGTLRVKAVNDCGMSNNRNLNITINHVSVSITNTLAPLCPGGSDGRAIALASNGTFPYSYSWNTTPVQNNDTATGLQGGTYIVTASDANGCTATAQTTITAPSVIVLSASSTHKSCPGGSNGTATANVTSGGTGSFTYSWNSVPVQNTQNAANLSAGNYIVTATDANGCTSTATVNIPQAPAVSVSVSPTNVSCFGGSNGAVTSTPSGGTIPFTYSWNTTPVQTDSIADNLIPGNYTVIVTDSNGCTASNSAPVTQPTIVTISTSFSNALCNGSSTGRAIAAGNGGIGPYSYWWNCFPVQFNDTASSLSAGTYTVTVTDANGCSKTSSVTISEPSALSISTTPVSTTCPGGSDGSATAVALGGTGTHAYSWNTFPVQNSATVSNVPAGSYTVTVTDANGCTKTSSVNIPQPPAIIPSLSRTNAHCFGQNNGTVTATSTGGTGNHTYSWNTLPVQDSSTAINLFAGTYTVTITDSNGCTKTSSISVSQPPAIIVQTTSVDANCNQSDGIASVVASGGVPGYTFEWTTVPPETTATINNLIAGIYGVTVTDTTGCKQTGFATVNNNSGMILNIDSLKNVTCFGMSDGYALVSVTNSTGPLSFMWLPSHDTTPFISGLPGGNVSITVTDTNNCLISTVISISEPPALNTVGNLTSPLCAGDTINIGGTPGASGGTPPYSFLWTPSAGLSSDTIPSPFAFPATTTIYSLVVTDSKGCSAGASDTVVVNSIATPVLTNSNDTLFCSPAPFYQWYLNGNPIPGADTSFYVPLTDGDYSVSVSDVNSCESASATISIILFTANLNMAEEINVYPNPTSGKLFIDIKSKSEKINGVITTMEGMVINHFMLEDGLNTIDIDGLRNGNYIIHLSRKGKHFSRIVSVIN